MNISNEDFIKLSEEQNKVIDSDVSKIVVSAGPGSGKTYTIVKKVSKELENLEEQRGVIVCSFTREASAQLMRKIINQNSIKGSFIGTIDSFVFQQIINPFKNRYLKQNDYETIKDKLKIYIPEIKSESNDLTRIGLTEENKHRIQIYCKDWMTLFKKGVYEMSFPAYMLAAKMLNNMNVLSEFIRCKFSTIYIDEAQDLNDFQHYFLRILVSKCQLKVVLIGDKNQSIYEFRGARPELFYSLKDKEGYSEYCITYSVRCHKSILDFSNLIVDYKYRPELAIDCRVRLGIEPSVDNIKHLEGNFMILCESNAAALKYYGCFRESNIDNVVYSKKINLQLEDKSFTDNYLNLIEELLKFKINVVNENPILTYPIEDIELFLTNDFVLTEKSKRVIKNIQCSHYVYILNVLEILSISVPGKAKEDLKEQLYDPLYLNHYKNFENINRILTIHSSKGLESDNVFVGLEYNPNNNITNEYRRKLFVGFSRAKNNLFISYKNASFNGSPIDNLLKQNLNKLTEL